MEDVVESLKKSLIEQRWYLGDRFYRLGHPFQWVDGDYSNLQIAEGMIGVAKYFSMCYETYPTPDHVKSKDFNQIYDHNRGAYQRLFEDLFPFLDSNDKDFSQYIEATTCTRTQDYSFIKRYGTDLPASNVHHIDIGPGLGSHAVYSLDAFSSRYFALDASPHSYSIQRPVFRSLSPSKASYLDMIEAENFGVTDNQISELANDSKFRIVHTPSWKFDLLQEKTMDLATATWVLNEVNYSAILWIMANTDRLLKPKGYFYIRDSGKLKPGRHNISYDQILLDMGYKEVQRFDANNRVEYFGKPRLFQKVHHNPSTFENMVEKYVGKFPVLVHGGTMVQNLDQQAGK